MAIPDIEMKSSPEAAVPYSQPSSEAQREQRSTTDAKIVVDSLYKVFGTDPERAMKLVSEGMGKNEIFAKTGSTVGVEGASFSVKEGEIFVIMGLSGSGKSTLVRLLNRLIEPTSGTVHVNGQDVTAMNKSELIKLRRHDMSMVFQSFALMPHRTVVENAAFGLEVAGVGKEERTQKALTALEQVGLKANANSYPNQLSGGMQQRVGLARAMAGGPSILLMDEAFSALDPLIRTEMQDELLRLQQKHQRTVVFITHDLDEAMRVGDRIAIMQHGRVLQIGTPEQIVRHPANDYVKSFFRNVDVSQVFCAGDIARRSQITVIDRPGSSVAAALQRLKEHNRDIAVVHDSDRRYVGVVTTDSLNLELGHDGEEAKLSRALVEGLEPLTANTPLSEVFGRVAQSRHPLPVVSDDGHYVGSISKAALLEALDRSGEE